MKIFRKLFYSLLIGGLLMTSCNRNSTNKNNESIVVEATVEKIEEAIDTLNEEGDNSLNLINAISDAFASLSIDDKKRVNNFTKLRKAQKDYFMKDGFVVGEFDEQNIVHRFGAISDIHNSPNIVQALNVLNNWDNEGMDLLMIAGDITDGIRYYNTGAPEIEAVKSKILNNVDPDLPIVMTLGNHDTSNGSFTSLFYDTLGPRFYSGIDNPTLAREKGLSHACIYGYHFICLEGNYETVAHEGITEDAQNYLKEKLKEITTSPDYHGEYIFILTHLLPYGTTYESSNSVEMGEILKYYPQAFVVAGHTHQTVTDELNIDQNYFTTLNPGAVTWLYAGKNYIESNGSGVIEEEGFTSYNLPQGTIIEIDENGNLRIVRLDFRRNDRGIREPWIISAPKNNNSHLFSYTRDRMNSKYNKTPYFENELDASCNYSINADGTYKVSISFNAAIDENDFIYCYHIKIYTQTGMLIEDNKSFSNFFLYADTDEMPDVHTVVFKKLTRLPYKISVAPIDCMRVEGTMLEQELLPIKC